MQKPSLHGYVLIQTVRANLNQALTDKQTNWQTNRQLWLKSLLSLIYRW